LKIIVCPFLFPSIIVEEIADEFFVRINLDAKTTF